MVNAKSIKQVPGRKTDMKDCEWIAELLRCGLLSSSFVPLAEIRGLRDLTRQRAKMAQTLASIKNRLQKILEDANIKISSVVTDILGVSGRTILSDISEGETDTELLADHAKRRLRAKIPELRLALEGKVTSHHQFLLKNLLEQVSQYEEWIDKFDLRIDDIIKKNYREEEKLLVEIPGVSTKTAQCIIAEIGADMSQFPSASHLASWAGICPGNNESAGKRKSGKTPKGNRWLRRILSEAAWGASKTKETYLSAQYKKLCPRRGKKRAIVAVGHSIFKICYHILKDKVSYIDLGHDYFNNINHEKYKKYYIKKLESLGLKVSIDTPPNEVA